MRALQLVIYKILQFTLVCRATALNFFKAEMSTVLSVLGTAAADLIVMIRTTD